MAARVAAIQTNLDKYQCMFTWYKDLPYPFSSKWVIDSVEDKLLTSDCEWQSIVYHLVLFYEYHRIEKNPEARDHLVECENIISDSECFATSPLVKRNIIAIKHVLYASWLHFISKTYSYDSYKDYLTEIVLYKNMNKKQKAGVVGIHSACLMEYGSKGNRIASTTVLQGIKHDEHEGHWHYLRGEALRYERLTSVEEVAPKEEEIKCFELAHFYDEHTPSHYIGLASVLYDSVRKEKGPSQVRDKATQLYKSALENWPNSAYVNIMCTSGLLSYAYPVRDTRLADQCLGKALRLSPKSSFVNLVAGIFFKWPNNNSTAANRHFNLAKKRYATLVDDITKGVVDNYRKALILGETDPAKIDIAPAPPAEDDADTSDYEDDDYDYGVWNYI